MMSYKLYIKKDIRPKEGLTPFESFEKITNNKYFPETYEDEECSILQCVEGCNRSINDIHATLSVFHPDLSIKDVCNLLFKHAKKNNYVFMICEDIESIVYPFSSWFPHLTKVMNKTFSDRLHAITNASNAEDVSEDINYGPTVLELYQYLGFSEEDFNNDFNI